jgi:YVTN family beta-propeller protein
MPPYVPFKYRRPLLATAVMLSFVIFWLVGSSWTQVGLAQAPPPSFRAFEAPQIHPLALTPDGTRLLAVNTPNATLSVFQLVSGSPVLTAEIPVGFEPVSVAARNDREAWVVNWLSDSVSIVDLTTGNVVRTLDVGDEPTDVLFAGPGNNKAFVCVAGGGLQIVGFSQITGMSGVVKVFDPNNPTVTPTTVEAIGKQPRALARNADGSRVFVSVFESGNQTTIVPESIVRANGGLPPPNPPLAPGLPENPNTSLIVKWDGSNWKDEINRSWTSQIPYTLADSDVVVLNASGPGLSAVVSARVRDVGTHIGNMAFDASTQQLFVANLEDINHVRFEPNIRGRFQASRVSILNASAATPTLLGTSDLNPHVDFGSPGSDAERGQSLALPADIVRQSDGTVYVAATSSARVGVLSSAGVVTGRIGVGQGPTGLALDEARSRLYVLNRFDQTLSVVDTGTKLVLSQLSIGFNPEPASVRDGRRFLYDATSFSAHGTVSCASCHLNGHRDGMAWDLGNPQGSVDPVTTFLPPNVTGSDSLHPMKGPMMTQSLRGIIGNEPFHWRGDRAGLENFNPAFVSLLGGPRLLSNEEMGSFKAFVQSLVYPPNPNHPQRRTPNEFLGGFGFFSTNKLFGPPGPSGTINCSECHLVTNFKVGSDNKITPAANIQESQSVKVAPFRGLYQKVGLNKAPGEQITGFGFSRDGSFDTLFNFQKAPQFNFGQAGSEATADSWRHDIEQMLLKFDTGTAPAVGLMVTVDATNKSSPIVTNRINNVLIPEAQVGNCDLIVRGIYGGVPRSFLRLSNGLFQPDSLSEAPVTSQTLINGVTAGAELTFMGVPPGEGPLFAIDRDANGILNDDEPRTSVQISGRVVDIAGNGIAGVTLTLSGKQSASAITDSQGKYVFNFISTTGTHTVTPQKTGLTFTPLDRSVTNPVWNVSASFTTLPTGSAADFSPFFVSQHYADFLNREPDAPGLAFWINQIESCGTDQDCRRLKRDNVSGAFFLSIEFKETGYLVYRTYKASFGDLPGKPVPITFQQLMTDTQRVARNVIVTPPPDNAWQVLLETNKQAFFAGWVQRPEFLARFPIGMSPTDFVDTLNANTGGSLTTAQRDALVNQLSSNNNTAGRASAVRQVAENSVFSDREFNKAFVLMQYFGYLRRNPDDIGFDGQPDPNFVGYNFWLTKLNQHNGNFIEAEMVKSFIVSIEYRRRFGQ